MTAEAFFTAAGQSSVFLSDHSLGLAGPGRTAVAEGRVEQPAAARERFGVALTASLAHSPHPHRISVLQDIEQRFPEEVDRTAHSPFRADTDLSLLSSLAQHYGLLTGSARSAAPDRGAFINLAAADVNRQLNRMLNREHDFFCIGDFHVLGLPPESLAGALDVPPEPTSRSRRRGRSNSRGGRWSVRVN